MPSARADRTTARRERALDLRIAGLRFRAIGVELGVSHVQAYKDVTAALGEIRAKTYEKAEQWREIELTRLDRWTQALAGKAEAGDHLAIRTLVLIQERRAKLIGLDAPRQIGISAGDGGPVVVQVIHRQLAQLTE
jgi:hypothetical protein